MHVCASVSTSAGSSMAICSSVTRWTRLHGRIHRGRNLDAQHIVRFRAPHQRAHDRLLGADAAVEIPERRLGRLPVEDRRMAGMRDDAADVGPRRQLAVERRRRIERHQQRPALHPRHEVVRNLAERDVGHGEDDHVGCGHARRIASGLDAAGAQVLQALSPTPRHSRHGAETARKLSVRRHPILPPAPMRAIDVDMARLTIRTIGARRRIGLRLIVQDEHPVEHFARVGRRERRVAGVGERADGGRLAVARVEPPGFDRGAA